MKNITSEFTAHLAQENLTLAQCWKLVRRDGVVLGFTEHDVDIALGGVVYKAASGLKPSAVESQASLAVDNLDVEGILDASAITEADILAGRYDFAQVETFLVNYEDLSQGTLKLRRGWLGEVQLNKQHFIAEVRGLTQKLAQHIGELYSPICRAQLGDERCGVNLPTHQVTGTVSSVMSSQRFTDINRIEAVGYFDLGRVTFTGGANNGLSREVKFFAKGGEFEVVLAFPYAVQQGDAYELVRGCDKTISTCINRYHNALNFRGEPHVPGIDRLLETAATL